MEKQTEKKKGSFCDAVIIIIYAIITLFIVCCHESWRDEAQAWLIAKELTIPELIYQMRYEGHFLLWYLILMPFAKLGFPYITENIISWFLVLLAVTIFVKKAPFSRLKKILFVFSFSMLYLFPVVARCYCFIPLAIVLISLFYKDRKEKPVRYVLSIVFLANTHVIMLGMVGILLLEFYIEAIKDIKSNSSYQNKKNLISFIIVVVLLILSILPLIGCLTANKDIGNENSLLYKLIYTLFLAPFIMVGVLYDVLVYNELIFSIIVITVFYLVYYMLKYYPKDTLKIWIILLWQYLIYAFLYGMSEQRASTIIWIVIFFLWNGERKVFDKKKNNIELKIKNICITILLILNILNGIVYIYMDITSNYSSAKQTAEFINNNIEEDSIMITGNQVEFCSSIIPYTDNVKYYHIQRKEYFTFAIIDEINRSELNENDIIELKEKFANKKLYYIYSTKKVFEESDEEVVSQMEENGIFEKVFESKEALISNEEYVIYKINLEKDIEGK